MTMASQPVICLMGPTAAGKTGIATQLADSFPLDLVSVDSALVYRDMNIGSAKPDADCLRRYPHRLIDIRDPEQSYSAGEFVRDALVEIDAIHADGRIPLLVGGTMMYFRSLIGGIASLPGADPFVRTAIDEEAAQRGWPEMHRQLAEVDRGAAAKINPNDAQRIQRGLEVYRLSGRSLSEWQSETSPARKSFDFIKIALIPEPRATLHTRIAERLDLMLDAGFVDEVRSLMRRPGLTAEHSSMRAVGYRQYWSYLKGDIDLDEALAKALAATRQLAKRQLTWLRSEGDLFVVNPLETDAFATISSHLSRREISG
jgi:tRNA dimethylallyltransferase